MTISSGDTSYQYRGINGKTITHSGTGNRITVGEAGKGNLPNISNGDVSGAGDAYELGDITDNTLIIRSIRVNGSVYGGRSRQGKITGNTVEFSGGTVVQSIYGGYTDNSSNANTLTGNRIDFSGGTVNSQLFGAATRGSGALTDNHVVVRGGIVEGTQFSAGAFSQGSGQVSGNTATLSSGSVKNLVGGVSQGTGHVTGNTLTISGGTAGILVGGYSSNAGNATGNTVTVIGGTVTGQIIGGNAAGSGAATGNTVNLGDGTSGTFKSGTNLTAADILGGNKTDVTGNTLNVYVKDASVKSVANFENYKFKLNSATTFDDTMLTVANAGDFAGTGVDLNKITVDSTGLSVDYLGTQHGIKRMTLLKRSNDTDTLTFRNYAAREAATATETHEFRFVTNNGTGTANALMLEASRFKGSHVTYDGTTPTFGGEVYGGLSRFGHTTTGNTLTVTGKPTSGTPLSYAYGGKNEGAAGDVKDNTATLDLPNNNTAIKDIYGGKITNAANAGEVSGNIVNMKQGTVEYAVGGQTDGTGAAKNNTVNLTGGTVTREIYGGLSDKGAATGNTVTISGGTVGSSTTADVYAGKKTTAAGSSASNNTVNLGAEDGTYTADLTKAKIHGDNSTDGAVNNNTLNVRGKNITVNSVDNFDKYKFTLNNNIKDGDTMLTLKNDGFGREIDFANNFGLDTSKLTGKPTGIITLVKSATGTLKFKSGYVPRDLGSTDNVEYFVGTDTGEREGSSVVMGYNIFKGNTWTYDGTNPPNAKELFGGASYNNHTTEGNTLTITNTSTTQWVGNTYGGKTAGRTGGSKNNRVVVENTGVGGGLSYVHGGAVTNEKNAAGTVTGNSVTLKNGRTSTVYGGYTRGKGAVGGSADGAGNAVTFENGTAGDVYGGAIDNSDSTAAVTGNKVTIQNGTYNRLYGGHTKGKGAAQNNEVMISGGTSSDDVHGGYTHDGGAATGNKVTLTGGVVNGLVYGGYTNNGGDATGNTVTLTGGKVTDKVYAGYADGGGATTNNTVNLGNGTGLAAGADLSGTSIYGGNRSDVTGNTLNVKGKNMTVKTAGKFENYTFYLGNDVKDGDTLLTFAQAGGFDGDDVDWSKLNLDAETLHAWSTGKQRTNTITLLNAAGMTFTSAANQRLLSVHDGMEYGLRTDHVGSTTANKIYLDANRFKDGVVDFTAATTGEALGGISHFGNTTESNRLTVKSLAAGAHSAYGGKTMGTVGGSIKNTVTVTGTGAGTLTNVYGGYVDKAANNGDVTGNTVTFTGGKVTGTVYGGYTNGGGKTTNNTVNIGADPTTLRQGDASTLAAGTDFTAAELYGGNKSDAVGNTLNVTVKDAAAKKAQNFDKYTFYLTNSVAADKSSSGTVDDTYTTSRGTMLTLANGFDGQTADWNKVTVDTSKLSADKTLGAITLMKSTAANKLKFSNYAAKNHAVSGDYEVVQRTDTNTGEANAVLIDVNRFRNGEVVYDGVNPNAKTYAGVSYGGNTAEKNTMTLTGIASGKTVKYLSGGRSEGAAGGAVNNTVNLVGTGAGTLEDVYGGYIGKTTNAANATGNTVNIAGGTAQNVYGGYTNGTGKTTGNIVNIGYTDKNGAFHAVADGTKVTGTIYGGSKSDDVTGNTLNVRGAITAGQIANFEKLNFAVNKDLAGKTLLSINGTAATTGLDWQKLTADIATTDLPTKSYGATRVTLMSNDKGIDFGTTYDKAKEVVAGDVYEFSVDTDTHAKNGKSVYADGYRFKDNKLATFAATDGTHVEAWGGKSVLGKTVEGNVLTVTGGKITDTAYGGTSSKGKAQNNKLVMRGGDVQTLKGGFGKTATDNTVDVFGGTVRGDVYGGHATDGDASKNTVNLYGGVQIGGTIHGGKASGASKNNTLAVRSFGTQAKDFDNVQNLHFYVPAGTTPAETRTMLTLTNTGAKDVKGLRFGVGIAGDAKAFKPGDAISLLKTAGTLATDAELKNDGKNTMTATQGGILDYTLSLAKRGNNELIATVKKVAANDRSKSPVETRVAASALLNAGADLLSNVGYTAAAEAAAVISASTAPAGSSAEGTRNTDAGLVAAESAGANAMAAVSGAFQPWAAQSGSAVRIHSGSYVDAKGWNLNVGFARTNEMNDAKLTYGPFVEYGRGTYDSYLDDGTHGSGAMHYVGGGVMAKMMQDSGLYVEGSLRAGRISRDYTGSGDAAELSYDDASTYYAAHIGVGQEWQLAGGDKIEGYAKYFYAHQAGNTTKLRSGADLEFGDVESHRLRVGARYTHAVGGGSELYAGLGYEYEFDGAATAMYQGYATPSPSLGGGTGILELGYRFAPKDGRVSYGVNLMGTKGKRDGIAGGIQVNWAF
ncbi:autotransporter outer membrane beta-barrel domain-containing protein [Selenomonas infelix]|uniref:autotransporter outer membrane beta-barrel domain-containing protein n=1 Tax=Selenomonas infelix TaxID=135082 RepID=UPI00145C7E8F|nr:autotransporter outer membrane beta-barrel domain-containing protein [Selenomonas infelix]